MTLTYGSVCSGIEAATVALEPLGWRPLWFAETERFPSAVLAHRYPHVPNLGDMTQIARRIIAGEVEVPDVLIGGIPCQGFSVAGLRNGLTDERNLTEEFVALADAIDTVRRASGRPPASIVLENVPGLLSMDDNAFGSLLGGLVGSGSAIPAPRSGRWTDAGVAAGPRRCAAWRVLDAQYFGLAQRRSRVFVLAGAGDRKRCADALLPIIESVRWHPAPRRKAGQNVAPTISARTKGGGGLGTDFDLDGGLIAKTLTASRGKACANAADMETYIPVSFGGNNTAGPIDIATACNAHGGPHGRCDFESETFVLTSGVRRLMPIECERLQGIPDNHTLIPYRGRMAADGPRYKALGNSFPVPIIRYIGERIEAMWSTV